MNRSKRSSQDLSKSVRRKSGTPPSRRSSHKSVASFSGATKRLFDIVASAAALVVLSPLLAATAAVIRLSDGGRVFYRQTRVGLDRRTFTVLKFRTMHEDAERDLGAIWSVPNDPRCTWIGKHLRRFGIDELPQLWNVLRGDMSLVGPRPERPEFTREFRKEHRDYDLRHTIRPGITGLAQANGWRGYTSLEERLRHDLYYVRNWSLALDAYVLALTLMRGWRETTRIGV
ncbi:MAG: sugar transferase [Acidobacteria bacterium]|nr:sugar transferase [Acidobacteriota bacterium]